MKNLKKTFRYVNSNGDSITFEPEYGFVIEKPVGIDTVQVKLTEAQGINQVGSTVQSKNVQSRAVNITGVLIGEWQEENKEKLINVIRPDLSGYLYADDYYLTVYPTATPTVEAKKKHAAFEFSLLAPYPYWQNDKDLSTPLSGLLYQFRLPCKFGAKRIDGRSEPCLYDDDFVAEDWEYSNPYRFAETVRVQFINVSNNGQLPVPYTCIFLAKGSVENPVLRNAVTNKYIRIDKTMIAGERIEIKITHEKTYVTSSVDGDIRGALSLSSELFSLDVGDNILKPEADSGLSELEVTVSYATETVGIVL